MTLRLLVVSQYWDPAELAGGARSTGRAVAALGERATTWVVTGDRDVGDPGPWPDLAGSTSWVERDGIRVRYQVWDRHAGRRVRAAIDEIDPDVIYLPSLFAPGSLAVLWRRAIGGVRGPVVVAPEGELHPGALAHHHGRKRVVLTLLRLSGLARRVHWRAADPLEATQIRALAGTRATVDVAPDLHGPPPEPISPTRTKEAGSARVVFVATIAPKKGLSRALELLWPMRHEVRFDIYGPIVDEVEWARCREVLDLREPGVEWLAHGPIPHRQVGAVLADADLCILPTLGENYGYVIAEALEAGCPVLTSDQTPWRQLAVDGCGWDLPIEPVDAWRDCVTEVIAWDDDDRRRVRTAARARAARTRDGEDAIVDAWRSLFERAATSTGRT